LICLINAFFFALIYTTGWHRADWQNSHLNTALTW
jgi:hypothetical protein